MVRRRVPQEILGFSMRLGRVQRNYRIKDLDQGQIKMKEPFSRSAISGTKSRPVRRRKSTLFSLKRWFNAGGMKISGPSINRTRDIHKNIIRRGSVSPTVCGSTTMSVMVARVWSFSGHEADVRQLRIIFFRSHGRACIATAL